MLQINDPVINFHKVKAFGNFGSGNRLQEDQQGGMNLKLQEI